jgi:hypothetical protein
MDTIFRDAEGNAFAGLERVRSDYQQTARSIYAALTVDAGDSTGTLNADRWRQSIKLATGGFTEVKGKRVMLPYGHDEASFRDGLRQRVDALVESGQVTKETGQKLRDLPLEMAGDGRYVFRSGDSVVLTTPANSKPVVSPRPIIIDFNISAPFRTSGAGAQTSADSLDEQTAQGLRRIPAGSSVFR